MMKRASSPKTSWELKENLKEFLDENFDLFATAIETVTVANNDLEKNINQFD